MGVPDFPRPGRVLGSFRCGPRTLIVSGVSGRPSSKSVYVFLGSADGPLVAVVRDVGGERPRIEVAPLWKGNSPAWREEVRRNAVSVWSKACADGGDPPPITDEAERVLAMHRPRGWISLECTQGCGDYPCEAVRRARRAKKRRPQPAYEARQAS